MRMHKVKATSQDYEKSQNWDTWLKEASEFPWKYLTDETCLILRGSATVRDFEGNELNFSEGDLVSFKKGLECVWKIHRDIEKKYILH